MFLKDYNYYNLCKFSVKIYLKIYVKFVNIHVAFCFYQSQLYVFLHKNKPVEKTSCFKICSSSFSVGSLFII